MGTAVVGEKSFLVNGLIFFLTLYVNELIV
jgi:hypothetical protein